MRIHFIMFYKHVITISLLLLLTACDQTSDSAGEQTKVTEIITESTEIDKRETAIYSKFGDYQPLQKWSDWCYVSDNPTACADALWSAVLHPSERSRPTVRAHGWKLWAAITAPLSDSGYDPNMGTSTKFGTTGCWKKTQTGSIACSGIFPLWLSWPNTGVPHDKETVRPKHPVGHLIATNRNFSPPDSPVKTAIKAAAVSTNPDPTKVQTVNTVDTAPNYPLPWLAVAKQCKLPEVRAKKLVEAVNKAPNKVAADKAWKDLENACVSNGVSDVICSGKQAFCDGNAFVNQGDVMIATESLSKQAWDAIQKHKLYDSDTLNELYNKGEKETAAKKVASWIDHGFISTKHMFWPVKGCRPGSIVTQEGCRVRYGALPPWIPANFKKVSYATDASYRGYETWGKVVAIDTCGNACPPKNKAELVLEDVKGATAITTDNPNIYHVDQFLHLQVSEETLQNGFTATDRALLDQATIWAYGSDAKGFEAGDFLVVVAMHVVTKEIDSWTFQSIWWSPMEDKPEDCLVTDYNHCFGQSSVYSATSPYSGLDQKTRSAIDQRVGTAWRNNYVLSDSYGIGYEIDGTVIDVNNYFEGTPPKWATQRPNGEKIGMLPVAMNVYIEPVIHPLGTNCHNCHRRAGIINKFPNNGEYAGGVGRANYQNSQCPSLLADYGVPEKDPCMLTPWAWNKSSAWDAPARNQCSEKAGNSDTKCNGTEAFPIVNTDLSWIISDGHIQKAD